MNKNISASIGFELLTNPTLHMTDLFQFSINRVHVNKAIEIGSALLEDKLNNKISLLNDGVPNHEIELFQERVELNVNKLKEIKAIYNN